MTTEQKELLLKDLCVRLPYGVKVLNTADGLNEICELDSIMTSRKHKDKIFVSLTLPNDSIMTGIESIKPYLRSMSNMTEKELEEYNSFVRKDFPNSFTWSGANILLVEFENFLDWLNSHYFDYRGLIERGLAIAVTEENNPYK